jgi:hypothetical protein
VSLTVLARSILKAWFVPLRRFPVRRRVARPAVLIPFLLLVPFIFTDLASGVGKYLPNRAGQLLAQQDPQGPIGPWAGLGVTALWVGAAVLAGWFAISRRDA